MSECLGSSSYQGMFGVYDISQASNRHLFNEPWITYDSYPRSQLMLEENDFRVKTVMCDVSVLYAFRYPPGGNLGSIEREKVQLFQSEITLLSSIARYPYWKLITEIFVFYLSYTQYVIHGSIIL